MLPSRKAIEGIDVEVSENANPLHLVPEVLMWRDASSLHSQLYTSHLELLFSKFEQAVAAFVKAGVGSRLNSLIQDISEDGLTRLITAPEMVRRLLYEPPTDLVFFLNSALAEQYRLSETCDVPKGVWTALGDYYFPTGYLDSFQIPKNVVEPWNPDRVFRAPHLSNGIPVDYSSPYAMRTRGPNIFTRQNPPLGKRRIEVSEMYFIG